MAGTWHREVNWEREAAEGRELFLFPERGKHPLPESSWRERERVETPARNCKKGREEKGEGFNTIKAL